MLVWTMFTEQVIKMTMRLAELSGVEAPPPELPSREITGTNNLEGPELSTERRSSRSNANFHTEVKKVVADEG